MNNEVWLSLVERYVRDVEVASSNLVTSTKKSNGDSVSVAFFYTKSIITQNTLYLVQLLA